MSHIRNYDIRFETLVGILVGMIALIADFFLRWSFWGGMGGRRAAATPAATRPARSSRSSPSCWRSSRRSRPTPCSSPSRAGASTWPTPPAVELTRNPLGLARALHAIAADPSPLRHANRATAHLYIENPLKKTKEVTGVFDTHPPIQQRIAVLLEMAHVGPEALAGAAAAGGGRSTRPAPRSGRVPPAVTPVGVAGPRRPDATPQVDPPSSGCR